MILLRMVKYSIIYIVSLIFLGILMTWLGVILNNQVIKSVSWILFWLVILSGFIIALAMTIAVLFEVLKRKPTISNTAKQHCAKYKPNARPNPNHILPNLFNPDRKVRRIK